MTSVLNTNSALYWSSPPSFGSYLSSCYSVFFPESLPGPSLGHIRNGFVLFANEGPVVFE